MKNILFSSTRQWNPGDEFILFGVRCIMDEMGIKYNAILYNRHPLLEHPVLEDDKIPNVFDNSYIESKKAMNSVDYVIFAGTPEWAGSKLVTVMNLIKEKNVKFSMIGIGGYCEVSPDFKELIRKNAEFIVARDEGAQYVLKEFGAKLGVCPGIFASKIEKQRTELKRIGICYQAMGYCAAPKKEKFERTINLYGDIIKKYDASIICHSFPDFIDAKNRFEDIEVYYSSYSEDYMDIYDKFDLIIGTRVHGAGLASSLGIPSITIKHDSRGDAVKLFLSDIKEPEEVMEEIEKINIKEKSKELIEYKKEKKEEYKKYLSETSLV